MIKRFINKAIKSDLILNGRYLASQCKVAILQKPKDYDIEFQLQYTRVFLEYCENPVNKVKVPRKLMKFTEANNKGTLKELLD